MKYTSDEMEHSAVLNAAAAVCAAMRTAPKTKGAAEPRFSQRKPAMTLAGRSAIPTRVE